MIRLIFTLVLPFLSSAQSLANECEPFKGRYQCSDDYGDVTTHQIDFPNSAQMRLGDDAFTWKEWVKLKDNADLKNRSGRATCSAKTIVTEFEADDVNRHGKVSGKMKFQSTWTKAPKGMTVLSEGVLTPTDGAPLEFKGNFVCTYEPVFDDSTQCPDLSGTYTCPLYSRGQTVKIEMSRTETGNVVYLVDDETIIADGKERPVTTKSVYRNGTSRAYCVDRALRVDMAGDYYPNDQFAGRMRFSMKRTRTADGSLDISIQGSLQDGGLLFPRKGRGLCVRN